MVEEFWNFIKEIYSKMPLWVQIPVFITLFVVVVYSTFTPSFIDGELTVYKKGKSSQPLPTTILEVNVDPGRWVRLHTKMDGRFTLPVPSKLPFAEAKVRIYPKGPRGGYFEESVRYFKLINKEVVLEYNPNNENGKDFYLLDQAVNSIQLIGTANAATLANPRGETVVQPERDNFRVFIRDTVSKEIGRSLKKEDNKKTFLELGVSNVNLAFVLGDIRDEYGLSISSDVWEYVESIDDLVIFSREEYYRSRPWGSHDSVRIEKLQNLFKQAKSERTLSVYVLYQDARLLRKSKKTFIAISILEDMVKEQNDFYLAWYDLALSYRQAGLYEKAKGAFKQAINLNEAQGLRHAAVYNTYGRFLYHLCEAEESLVYLQKVLDIDPNYGETKTYIKDTQRLNSGEINLSTCSQTKR